MKIDLRKPDLRKTLLGTVVITTTGHEFELIALKNGKESWRDLTSGLIWHDIEDDKITHYEAMEKFPQTADKRLPTIEEFEGAEKHGFREVLPNINYWFWSASFGPNYRAYGTDYARGFNGYDGSSYYFIRGDQVSVRCISRLL